MQTKKYTDLMFRDITTLGGSVFYCILMVFFLFVEKYSVFLQLLFGFLLSHLITIIIRAFYFKIRPKKERYTNFIEKIDASSFPSAHAQRAVILLIILSYFFNSNFVFVLLLVLALLVIYSRIYFKKHYIPDIIVGIIIGVILGVGALYYI